MKTVQAVKKLNSISGERLNFWRGPILCTTLYGNVRHIRPTFPFYILCNFHARCPSTFCIPWCKKVKNDQKLKPKVSCFKSFHKDGFTQGHHLPRVTVYKNKKNAKKAESGRRAVKVAENKRNQPSMLPVKRRELHRSTGC